jgi:hypothetical protein
MAVRATAAEEVAFVLQSEEAVMPFHVAYVGASLLSIGMAATKRTASKRVAALMKVVGVNGTGAIFGQILTVLRYWCSSILLPELGIVMMHLISGALLVFWLGPDGAVPYGIIGDTHTPVFWIDSDAEEDMRLHAAPTRGLSNVAEGTLRGSPA